MALRISVVIPTRNRASLLPAALESVLRQTLADWELIVVDDGSEDDTELCCERYLSDSRIHFCRTRARGVSAARNAGIAQARAEWLAFLDSDDTWMAPKLSKQWDLLRTTGDRICHTDEIWIRRGKRVNPMKKHRKQHGWIFSECLPLCAISPSSVLIHRSVFERVGGFDESYAVCEDYELWLRVAARYRVSLVSEKLVTKFGGHDDQLSRRFWGMDRWRARALYSRVLDSDLPWQYRQAAFDEMKRKLEVLMRGYARRHAPEALQVACFLDSAFRWWSALRAARASAGPPPDIPWLSGTEAEAPNFLPSARCIPFCDAA